MAGSGIKIRIMKTVSAGTREIVKRRVRNENLEQLLDGYACLAVVHGNVCDLIYASDVAQKTSAVEVFEIPGNCPQHMTCLGILGEVSAVEAAVQKIKTEFAE